MKKVLKAAAAGGTMAMLLGGGLLANANVNSDAVIRLTQGGWTDLQPSNARIVSSDLDLYFGEVEFDNNDLWWNEILVPSLTGPRHITVLDEISNSGGWHLNVQSTGFRSDEGTRHVFGWWEYYSYQDEDGNWREGQRWVEEVEYEHQYIAAILQFGNGGAWLDSSNPENILSWSSSPWLSTWGGSSRVATGFFGHHTFNWQRPYLSVHSGQVIQPGTYRNTLTWSIEIAPVFNSDFAIGGE